jgi:hypothetical protein
MLQPCLCMKTFHQILFCIAKIFNWDILVLTVLLLQFWSSEEHHLPTNRTRPVASTATTIWLHSVRLGYFNYCSTLRDIGLSLYPKFEERPQVIWRMEGRGYTWTMAMLAGEWAAGGRMTCAGGSIWPSEQTARRRPGGRCSRCRPERRHLSPLPAVDRAVNSRSPSCRGIPNHDDDDDAGS